ncbi:AMP-binding protein [Endozoicomonas sp. SM1973]|uniref:AMP-binding protein n=1 Tax=Spartinivicinus marinus TaxID=2994442 RepID=A0A853I4U8_9GAMM|nr:AMP-binding protein [Spartinivicinus marinus]
MATQVSAELQPIIAAFSEVLDQNPDAPAVEQGDVVRSYRQLSEAAQRIADQLLNAGVISGQRLALDLPRSIALYETILGCLVAGISFMALPRGLDQTKGLETAKKANCVGVLSNNPLFPGDGIAITDIGRFFKLAECTQTPAKDSKTGVEIYCVRTSGTTGEPKVVPINSGQLTAFLDNTQQTLAAPKYAKWLWIHDLSFDFSIWETFGCLAHNGCLVILDEHIKRDAKATFALMVKAGVNILSVTPSEFRYIFSQANNQHCVESLHLTDVIFCGEKLSPSTLLAVFDELSRHRVRLFNTYGPSEATVFCSHHLISKADLELESIPIGKPFPGMKFELVAINELGVGELVLRGAQVFDGYLGGELITDGYHTSDMCQVVGQGKFVCLGRSSGYQKINGFRVEPYEVEEYLQSIPNIDEAVVLVENSHQGSFLMACIRVQKGAQLSTRDLRLACSKLPPYLRPARYLLLNDDKWPVNDRGKTDRLALRRSTCGEI